MRRREEAEKAGPYVCVGFVAVFLGVMSGVCVWCVFVCLETRG